MSRILPSLLIAGLLFACPAAQANTFTASSGAWSKKTDWSAGHPPTVEEEPLTDNGHIVGPQNLTVFGAVHLAPGSFDWGTVTAEDTT